MKLWLKTGGYLKLFDRAELISSVFVYSDSKTWEFLGALKNATSSEIEFWMD